MTFKNGESPDNRRTFEDLYDDLLKPMVNQNEKLRIAPKQEEEKIKEGMTFRVSDVLFQATLVNV